MTLLIGLPTILWGMNVLPAAKSKKNSPARSRTKEHQINRLSLLLTLTAVLFFTGAVWALARKGRLDSGDGLVLVGLFLFWQCFHVFDVLKSNVRQNKSFSWMLPLDLAVLAIGAYGIYVSTDWLVDWLSQHPHRLHQRQTPGVAQRLADGPAQRPAGLLLRLAREPRSRLYLAGRRRAHQHPAVHWDFRPLPPDPSAPVLPNRRCDSPRGGACCTSSSWPCSGGCPGSWAGSWSPPTGSSSGKDWAGEV